jgi:hypothetical protein
MSTSDAVRSDLRLSIGAWVERPDLAEETVATAIADRLAFEGKNPEGARMMLKKARSGEKAALLYLKGLLLPPPASPLRMPTQQLVRNGSPAAAAVQERHPSRTKITREAPFSMNHSSTLSSRMR